MPLVYPSLASRWHESNASFEVGNLAGTYSRHQHGPIHAVKVNWTSILVPNMEEYILEVIGAVSQFACRYIDIAVEINITHFSECKTWL